MSQPQASDTTGKKSDGKWFRALLFTLWGVFLLGILGMIMLFAGISNGMFGELPTFVDLESPKSSLASEIYSREGDLLGKIYIVDRSNAEFDELPKHLINALVCTEDVRFYEHSGVDFKGIVRAVSNQMMGKNAGGGSTLTQQLAKNLFHERPGSTMGRIKQKLKEWVIAVKLEKSYTKEEILTMYLNTVPFSHNAHGIKAASNVYFNTSPDSLDILESAVLVGMLKGSTAYNPIQNPERSKVRRNVVLAQMAKYGRLSQARKKLLQERELVTDFSRRDHNEGLATYFREYIRAEMKEWAKKNVKMDGTNFDIYRDGLKIHTTISSAMQQYAEEAVSTAMPKLQKQFDSHWKSITPWDKYLGKVKNVSALRKNADPIWYNTNELLYRAIVNSDRYYDHKKRNKLSEKEIKKRFETPVKMNIFTWGGEKEVTMSPIDSINHYKNFLHTGFMAMDPQTGDVLAWVGGINHKHFKYDNVRLSSKRQVGSTFKPFVYSVAVENGWSPCRQVPNIPVTFPNYNYWTPKNSGSYRSGQMVTLKSGLAHSINQVTAYLMKQITPEPVVEMAERMGIESDIEPYPSICLGTPAVSVYEMVGAYSTFANKGFHSKPRVIERIEDKNGNPLQVIPPSKSEVMSAQTAYAMLTLLKGVTDQGTGSRLRRVYKFNAEIAGKTGTTNENSDGWYIGLTPNIIAGAWVGGDEKTIRFRETRYGCGANMALPIWGEFMKRVYADPNSGITQNDRFPRPRMNIELDCSKYKDPIPVPANPNDPNDPANNPDVPDGGGEDFDYNDEFN